MNYAFERLLEDTLERIDVIRERFGYEPDDGQFAEEVISWFDSDTYHAYLDWYAEGED